VPITGNWRSLELNSSEHEVVAASARVARRKWVKRYRTRCPLGPFIPQFQTLCVRDSLFDRGEGVGRGQGMRTRPEAIIAAACTIVGPILAAISAWRIEMGRRPPSRLLVAEAISNVR
jgi:hypothetical protein